MNNTMPIITLELANMKATVKAMLSDRVAMLDADVQRAVDEYCTPENMGEVVRKTAKEALDAAVREEVRSFFGHGRRGRMAVREAVKAWLDDYYPLDEEDAKG